MAYLRSAAQAASATKDSNGGAGDVAGEKKPENVNGGKPGKMTLVIFVGLLIDLLAFTLILPLFPALLDHYRDACLSLIRLFGLGREYVHERRSAQT